MRERGDKLSVGSITAIRLVLLVGSVAAIVYGVTQGQAMQVLMKGVYVCLECIGIA